MIGYTMEMTKDYLTEFFYEPVELEQLERFFLCITNFSAAWVMAPFFGG